MENTILDWQSWPGGGKMPLSDFISDLPSEKQEAFKVELAKYTEVASIDRHPEFQRQLSLKHETTMANWERDKKPVIIEEEIKKRGTKQPWEIEIEKMRAENAELQQQAILKDRKSQAIAELAKHGIDPDLADFVITADETKFGENLGRLVGKVTSFRDAALKAEKEKIYSQGKPKAGQSGMGGLEAMSQTELMQYAKRGPAEQAEVIAMAKNKR
jgi:hypothetical protein